MEEKKPTFLAACSGENVDHTPIWLMRQAGRYMKEYRDVRSKVTFLELCKNPDLASKVTVDAARILGTDAAIIFADILLITEPLGFNLSFEEGHGPRFSNPFEGPRDLSRIEDFDAKESLGYVGEAIEATIADLGPQVPCIGFAGAPFTVASYLIEGGPSKNFFKTKTLMRDKTETWGRLLGHLATKTLDYLKMQVESGATCIQLFDSWIGCLSKSEFEEHVAPHSKKIFEGLPKGIPSIYFGANTNHLLESMSTCGSDIMGIDTVTPLGEAMKRLPGKVLQGNLDPTLLYSDWSVIQKEAEKILKAGKEVPGHIFNLGHGILPTTPVDNVKRLIDFVQAWTS